MRASVGIYTSSSQTLRSAKPKDTGNQWLCVLIYRIYVPKGAADRERRILKLFGGLHLEAKKQVTKREGEKGSFF